jgi:hypothetical protein
MALPLHAAWSTGPSAGGARGHGRGQRNRPAVSAACTHTQHQPPACFWSPRNTEAPSDLPMTLRFRQPLFSLIAQKRPLCWLLFPLAIRSGSRLVSFPACTFSLTYGLHRSPTSVPYFPPPSPKDILLPLGTSALPIIADFPLLSRVFRGLRHKTGGGNQVPAPLAMGTLPRRAYRGVAVRSGPELAVQLGEDGWSRFRGRGGCDASEESDDAPWAAEAAM